MSETFKQAVDLVVEGAFEGDGVNPDDYASLMLAAAVKILVKRHGARGAFDMVAGIYDLLAIRAAKER